MSKSKKTLTGLLAGFISVMLAVVMAVGVAYMPNITVNAAIVNIETVEEGKPWTGSWSSLEEYKTLEMVVDKAGFYNLTFTDHKQNGVLAFSLSDENYSYAYDEFVGSSEYAFENLFLPAGKFELLIGYFDGNADSSDYVPMDGKVTFEFNKANYTPITLPNCDVNSSKMQIVTGDTADWFTYTTTQAGDYSFNYSNYYADLLVKVYDAETGERVGYGVSEQYVYEYDEWLNCDRIVFNLDANTTYYVSVGGYENGQTMKISMTKNEKTVKNIAVNECRFDSYSPFWDVVRSDFDYKITYTDGTTEIVEYFTEILYAGYNLPYVEYVGGWDYYNNSYHLHAGRQPVESTYGDIVTTTYINVTSLYDLWEDASVKRENQSMWITSDEYEEQTYYWSINVSQSGYYGVYRYDFDDFGTNFEYFNINMVDYNNKLISYDNVIGGWPLEANTPYKLIFSYKYYSDCTWNDIEFWLQKTGDLKNNGWVQENGFWYYYENGSKLTNQWRKDSVGWVYLGSNGAMLTNAWCRDSAGWCYVGADGYAVTNCWKKDSIGWIWLNSQGSMTKNEWVCDGGLWYYLDENGYMVTNQWRRDSVGWVYIGSSGAMLTNAWCRDSAGWCYVGADGYAVTNCWKQDSVGWIWLNGEGSMTKNQWLNYGGSWYYLDGEGYMLANTSRYIGGKTYYFNGSRVCTNP